jgi:tetratricopeptide (TPR) repeat protein
MGDLLADLSRDPRGRALRWASFALPVAALCGAALLYERSGARPSAECASSARDLAGVWDGPRKTAVRSAFAATGRPHAAAAFEAVEQALDSYTRDWSAMRYETCAAAVAGRAQSEGVRDQRMRCLASRVDEVKALTDLFVAADGALVDRSVDAARTLAPIADCGRARALEVVVPPPSDPAIRERLTRLEAQHARAHAWMSAGKIAEALALARDAAADARALGYRPLEARLLLLLGTLLESSGALPESAEALRAGVLAAETGHDDATRAALLTKMADVVGHRMSSTERGLAYAADAAAVIERIGGDLEAEARLFNARGVILSQAGRMVEALADLERSRALWERVPKPPILDVARPVGNMAVALHALGRYGDALARNLEAEESVQRVAGAHHPESARLAMNRGVTLARLGRPREAYDAYRAALAIDEEVFGVESWQAAMCWSDMGFLHEEQGDYERASAEQRRALAIFEKVYGPDDRHTTTASYGVASVLARMDRPAEALARFERVLATSRRLLGPDHPDVAEDLCQIGAVELRLGRAAEALATFREAQRIAEVAVGPSHDLVSRALAGMGRTQLRLGAADRALAPLERAVALYAQQAGADWDRAVAQFDLARALWATGRDRARAIELAREARSQQLRLGDLHPSDVAPIAKWLRANAPS